MFLHNCILHAVEWAFELPIAWTHDIYSDIHRWRLIFRTKQGMARYVKL